MVRYRAPADEFGTPQGATAGRYGWLGSKDRASDTPGGLTLMGARLYTPTLGRFLQTDPVPGGSANSYDYAAQDPINAFDLDGRLLCPGLVWRTFYVWGQVAAGYCYGACMVPGIRPGRCSGSESCMPTYNFRIRLVCEGLGTGCDLSVYFGSTYPRAQGSASRTLLFGQVWDMRLTLPVWTSILVGG